MPNIALGQEGARCPHSCVASLCSHVGPHVCLSHSTRACCPKLDTGLPILGPRGDQTTGESGSLRPVVFTAAGMPHFRLRRSHPHPPLVVAPQTWP